MKNQRFAPRRVSSRAVPLANAQVSKVHCTVVGEHCGPVRSDVALLEARKARSLSRMT